MMKKFNLTIIMYIVVFSGMSVVYGQGNSSAANIMTYFYNNLLVFMALAALIGVLSVTLRLIWSFIDVQKKNLDSRFDSEIEDSSSKSGEEKSFLSELYEKAWNIAPVSKEADIDLGHDFDGIRELDNSLPPWWLYMFYGTIIFAVAYIWYYNVSEKGPSQIQEYQIAMEVAELQKAQQLSAQGNMIDETSVTVLMEPAAIEEGKEIYVANCAVCHGHAGEGLVGPNFVDKYWVHGGSINDIFRTIKYGVPEKGMIAWKDQLRPAAMQKVASYILTFQGTNPPNQKEAEGELYEPKVEVDPTSDEAVTPENE